MSGMFVVCHMLASLDGKIDGAFFGAAEAAPASRAYGELRKYYGCQATLYGTTTMLGGYADGKVGSLSSISTPLSQEDWVNVKGRDMGNFVVSVDPKGELAFSSHISEKKGREPAHIIEALTEQAAPKYLAYLREKGVSYVFAGKEALDCGLLLQKLHNRFGIERLMVAGGGVMNWSFLSEGLLDEISLVVAPVADGSNTAVSIFEQAPFLPGHSPVGLTLQQSKVLEGETGMIHYSFR